MRLDKNHGLRWRAAAATAAFALVLAACGSDDGDGDGGPSGAPEGPLAFEPQPAFTLTEDAATLEWPAALLHEESVFLLDHTGMSMFDINDGEELSRVEPDSPVLFDSPELKEAELLPPVLAEVEGEPAVLAGFAVEHSGGAQFGIEVLAMHAESGELLWNLAGDDMAAAYSVVPNQWVSVTVSGYSDGAAVLSMTVDRTHVGSAGISTDDPEFTWDLPDFSMITVHDGVAGGLVDGTTSAVDITDGSEIWSADSPLQEYSVWQAGPWMNVVEDEDSDAQTHRLTNIHTGEDASVDADAFTSGMFCLLDDVAAVVVCIEDGVAAVALDVESDELLWQESQESWDATFTGLWGGALYVTDADGPAVLDARSGEVLESDPGVTAKEVNEHAALVQSDQVIHVHHTQD